MQGGKLRKGPWLEEEDEGLTTFVTLMGERKWDSIARASGRTYKDQLHRLFICLFDGISYKHVENGLFTRRSTKEW